MQPKVQFHILGWVTLLIFPVPALWALSFFEDQTVMEVLAFDELTAPFWLLGIQLGFIYAMIVVAFSQFPIFKEVSLKQERLIKSLNLGWFDVFFISICAGVGEEILFRAGIQTWLGPILTSFLFIALHGYFHPLSWRKSLLGIVVLPFILILAYAYEVFGLWFCIAAHFSYDLLLLSLVIQKKKSCS